MKKKLLPLLFLLLGAAAHAQKVDLDRFSFDVAYQRLPQEPIKFEERTYGVKTFCGGPIKTNYLDETGIYDKVYINAWKRVEDAPKVGVEVRLEDFLLRGTRLETKTNETKDKDGKVTSRTTTYYVVARYEGIGRYSITGPITPRQPTKAELEEQKKKDEAKTTNRFLANVTTTAAPANNNGMSSSLNNSFEFSTEQFSSAKEAETDYARKKEDIYQKNLRSFVDNSISNVNNRINGLYGFMATSNKEFLWILDSKSHPEYTTQQEAIQAVKEIFKGMKANEAIDVLEQNVTPLIDYLQSLKQKYASDSKADKKMRYSAFYNLAKIYYYIDKPQKSLEEAEGLVKNDYDKDDGDMFKKNAETLIEELKRANVSTRHNVPLN